MRIWRPPNTGVFTALPVLVIGGAAGSIQTVCFAFHVPAIWVASRAWASPGLEAFSQAAIIACCSGDIGGAASWAPAVEPTNSSIERVAIAGPCLVLVFIPCSRRHPAGGRGAMLRPDRC